VICAAFLGSTVFFSGSGLALLGSLGAADVTAVGVPPITVPVNTKTCAAILAGYLVKLRLDLGETKNWTIHGDGVFITYPLHVDTE
jgi:hypothetical protein